MPTKRWRAADGVELVGDVAGTFGLPTVVLMHGGGQTRHSWAEAVPPLLGAGYGVINFDLRGHGESGWSADGDYSLTAFAADLRVVTAGLSTPVAWVGASLGGITALAALASGLRPAAVVLVDIALAPEPEGVNRIRRFMQDHAAGFASIEAAAAAVAAYNPGRPRPSEPAGLLKNLRLRTDGRYYWHWDPQVIHGDLDEFQRETTRLAAALRAVDVPMLLVRGARSDVVSAASVAAFRAVVPQVEVYEVPAAGHMVAGDSNGAFTAGVLPVLSRCFPALGA